MKVTPNASPDELNSPFYLENEKGCKEWEEYILGRGGKIMGNYNASSYALKCKITEPQPWVFDIKKSTYTGGFLLFSSKYQSLQNTLILSTLFKNTGYEDFRMSKSGFKRKAQNHPFYNEVLTLLKANVPEENLFDVTFKNNELKIEIHDCNSGVDIVDRIVAFQYGNKEQS